MPSQARVSKNTIVAGPADARDSRMPAAKLSPMGGSAVAASGSPALALQQMLVERMADTIEASRTRDASGEITRWPGVARIAFILGASAGLWAAIATVVRVAL